ncbi:hypothetical protein BJY01DRAFT_214385 [Aspergillus pseudoustus]|uniref:Uncharacterized protein n=1 Tax=Aspergillus pseudoustus TaxID=1810923 RepID=A0ABR4JZ25_9EURO
MSPIGRTVLWAGTASSRTTMISDLQIPSVAITIRGDEIAGDPNRFARSLDPGGLYRPVYQVHGYTPRRPFLITTVLYVFATSG